LLDALKAAVRSGRVEAVERERYFSSSALARFRETVLRIGAASPITPQLLRDETGLSRKFLIPLLEWSDRMGITLRSGESRALARRRTTPVGGG
jgi:selenocysteine-specific elongation factor